MFDMTLPDNIHAKIVKNHDDYYGWLRDLNVKEGNGEWHTPHIDNADHTPMIFPCYVGVRVYPGIGSVSIVYSFDIREVTNLTYHLCKAGAKLGDVIGTV